MNYQGKTFGSIATLPKQINFKGPSVPENEVPKLPQFNFQPKRPSVPAPVLPTKSETAQKFSAQINYPMSHPMPSNKCDEERKVSFKVLLPVKSNKQKIEDIVERYIKNMHLAVVEKDYEIMMLDDELEESKVLDSTFNDLAIRSLWIMIEFGNEITLDILKSILRMKLAESFVLGEDKLLIEQIQKDYRKMLKNFHKMEAKVKEADKLQVENLCNPQCDPICKSCLEKLQDEMSEFQFRDILHKQLVNINLKIKQLKENPLKSDSQTFFEEELIEKETFLGYLEQRIIDVKVNELKTKPSKVYNEMKETSQTFIAKCKSKLMSNVNPDEVSKVKVYRKSMEAEFLKQTVENVKIVVKWVGYMYR